MKASLKSLFQPASYSISAFGPASRARPAALRLLTLALQLIWGGQAGLKLGLWRSHQYQGKGHGTRKNSVCWNFRVCKWADRHVEYRKAAIFVSKKELLDTKNKRMLEFTCSKKSYQTRRFEEVSDFRVIFLSERHEE